MFEISGLVSSLPQNPWFAIAGFIVGFLGFIGMIYLYFKGRKIKLPFYYIRNINVVEDLSKFKPLKMSYYDKQIENFSIAKIVFWNGGTDTIDCKDISSAEPLILHVKKGYEILDSKVIYKKNDANQFSFSPSDDHSYIKLQFDYLDPRDGAIIQIIHTGTSEEDIEVDGKIKGVGKPIMKSLPSEPIKFSNRLSFRQNQYLAGLIFILFALLPLYSLLFSNLILSQIIGNSVMFIITFLFGIFFLKIRIPKGFESFYDEL